MKKFASEIDWIRAVGFINWAAIALDRLKRRLGPELRRRTTRTSSLRRLAASSDGNPLFYRSGSSDPLVFHQIFVEREYSSLLDLSAVEGVIDCGANVGYSSAWFLSHFPECRVLAIEPDSANFRVLTKNLGPYGSRVLLHRGALWSHQSMLVASDVAFRDGREWSYQFVESEVEAKNGISALSVLDAMKLLDTKRISILKIDIEGAETQVFNSECGQWLHLVDTLVVEIHEDSPFGDAAKAFTRMMHGQPFQICDHGELKICRRTIGP